jgi:hypothetical protein
MEVAGSNTHDFVTRHMQAADPALVRAMSEFLAGRSASGEPLGTLEEWHRVLSGIVSSAKGCVGMQDPHAPEVPCRKAGLSDLGPADLGREMDLVRSWMRVGSRASGHVFFGADVM